MQILAALTALVLATQPPEPAVAPLEPAATARASTPPPRTERKYVWGLDRPAPTWKIAAVASAASLTGIYLASALGLSVALRTTMRKKLLDAVDHSHVDDNPNNDIDRSEPSLCAAARATPPGEPDPRKVTNAKITQICNTGDGMQRAAVGLWVATAVGVVATAALTTLLFVRRTDRRPRRFALQIGAMPGRVDLGVGGRF